MYRPVQSSIILKSDVAGILQSAWAAHNGLAGALPVREVQIYQRGFLDALRAVGLAGGVQWQAENEGRAAALPSRIDGTF